MTMIARTLLAPTLLGAVLVAGVAEAGPRADRFRELTGGAFGAQRLAPPARPPSHPRPVSPMNEGSMMRQNFQHNAIPNHQYTIRNSQGGTNTITSGPTIDPTIPPGHRFESTTTRGADGGFISKETRIHDVHGDTR